jgi:hypothetical protein
MKGGGIMFVFNPKGVVALLLITWGVAPGWYIQPLWGYWCLNYKYIVQRFQGIAQKKCQASGNFFLF